MSMDHNLLTNSSAFAPKRLREERVPEGKTTDAFWFSRAMILVLAVVALDFKNYLILGSPVKRYAVMAIPFVAIVVILLRSRSNLIRNASATDLLLLTLLVFALPGTVSSVKTGGTSTIMPFCAAVVVGLLYLGTVERISEWEAGKLVRYLGGLGLVYSIVSAVGYSGLAPWVVQGLAFRNAKLFLFAMGVAGAMIRWRKGALFLVLPLSAVIFRGYPSATFVLVALVTVFVLFGTRPNAARSAVYVLILASLGVGLVAMLNVDRSVALVSDYFATVGKVNNNVVRSGLWKVGFERWLQSPIYGSAFTGPTSVSVWIQHPPYPPYRKEAPLHNDYLTLAASGGLIAVGLFVLWGVGTNVRALRRFRVLSASGRTESANLLRILLVGFNTWLCIALFNPLLQETGSSAALMALYTMIMMIDVPRSPSPTNSGEGEDGEPVRLVPFRSLGPG